jgi:hypothetical protein
MGSDQQGEGAEIMNAPTTYGYEHPPTPCKAVVAPPD